MKALIRDRYGPPDVLEVRDIERPAPKEREVLVRVHAASINDWDWQMLQRPMLPLGRKRHVYGFSVPISRDELPRSAAGFSILRSETRSTVICLASGLAVGADLRSMSVLPNAHWHGSPLE